MKDCSSCFRPSADSTIKESIAGSQLRWLMPVTTVTFAGNSASGHQWPLHSSERPGRLSLLRRRDSDAFLLARVGHVRDGSALHVALPAQIVEIGSPVHGAAIIPDDQIMNPPAMRIDELALR